MNYQLSDVIDNGRIYSTKLQEVGIVNTEQLLTRAATNTDRQRLAQTTGIGVEKLSRFVQSADLLRIKGIDRFYAALLYEADVCSVSDLAECDAVVLFNRLAAINKQYQISKDLPPVNVLADFIVRARRLPILLEHQQSTSQPTLKILWKNYSKSLLMMGVGFSMGILTALLKEAFGQFRPKK